MTNPLRTAEGLPKGNDQFVEAFARGLAVIRVFGRGSTGLTLSEVAERAGVSPAGARRLLHTLVSLGYARVRGRAFELTPAVLDLGYSYLSSLTLRDMALPYLEQFARETGELCSVAVLDRTDIIYVARAEVRSPSERRVTIGERLPAHATSAGHMLLTQLTDAEFDEFLARAPFERLTANTLVDATALKQAVQRAREDGFAFSNQQLVQGLCGLSVPVRDREGRIVATLTTSLNTVKYPADSIVEKFLPTLKALAEQCVVA